MPSPPHLLSKSGLVFGVPMNRKGAFKIVTCSSVNQLPGDETFVSL